jgi:hypothetical protein
MNNSFPKITTQADIAERAHQIYLNRNREEGYDISHWVQAEQELHEEFQRSLKSVEVLAPRPETKRKTQSA